MGPPVYVGCSERKAPMSEADSKAIGRRAVVNTSRLDADPRPMAGWLDGAVLELGEADLVDEVGPIHYQLEVQRFADELLVKGFVESEIRLVCSKTAEIFSTTVRDSGFVRSFPLAYEAEDVDLTEDLREAILLLIPAHPVHPAPAHDPVEEFHRQERERMQQQDTDSEEGDPGIWDLLDRLDIDNE